MSVSLDQSVPQCAVALNAERQVDTAMACHIIAVKMRLDVHAVVLVVVGGKTEQR